jgi:hypothetical protein
MIDYLTYLNYEISYLEIDYNLVNQALAVYEDIIRVYRTLGLGLKDAAQV